MSEVVAAGTPQPYVEASFPGYDVKWGILVPFRCHVLRDLPLGSQCNGNIRTKVYRQIFSHHHVIFLRSEEPPVLTLQLQLRDNLLARPPKRVDRQRGTKCVGLKCICVVKTLSRGIICIKTSFFLFFSNFGFRETLISSPGILKDRSSSNIQCPEGSYNTQQIMNTRCFLGD